MFYDFWRGGAFQYKFSVFVCRIKILSYFFYSQYLSIAVIDIAFVGDEFVISPIECKVTINHSGCYSYYEHLF